jgi:hypothetical protein
MASIVLDRTHYTFQQIAAALSITIEEVARVASEVDAEVKVPVSDCDRIFRAVLESKGTVRTAVEAPHGEGDKKGATAAPPTRLVATRDLVGLTGRSYNALTAVMHKAGMRMYKDPAGRASVSGPDADRIIAESKQVVPNGALTLSQFRDKAGISVTVCETLFAKNSVKLYPYRRPYKGLYISAADVPWVLALAKERKAQLAAKSQTVSV